MIRDYFADLELESSADLEDVRQAYRRLARRFHPDLNPKDPYSHESFKRIAEAYAHLASEDKIEHLRNLLELGESVGVTPWKDDETVSAFGVRDLPDEDQRKEEALDIHLMVATGAGAQSQPKQRVHYKVEQSCGTCHGAGGSDTSVKRTCKRCAGLGYRLIRRGAFRWKKTCETCIGRGFEVLRACPTCQGYGKIRSEIAVDLEVPQQIQESKAVLYRGHGHYSIDGKRRGDLWVNWRI